MATASDSQESLFHAVISFPEEAPVFDLSGPFEGITFPSWGFGKYNERRPYVYSTELFSPNSPLARNIHLGIDFFAPVGTPVYSFADGEILHFGYNAAAGDYGHVFVLEVAISETLSIYGLYGHLSKSSIDKKQKQKVKKGEVIGWLGDKDENGGYPPHLHFQLSWERPTTHDMPGTCCQQDLVTSLLKYPDPRLILGPVYKD